MRGAECERAAGGRGGYLEVARLRYYHKAHEGWKLLDLETTVVFTLPDQTRLEIALEPAIHFGRAAGATCVDTRDGFFGIGIVGGKNETNQGTLWRSAAARRCIHIHCRRAVREDIGGHHQHVDCLGPAYAYEDWAPSLSRNPTPPLGLPWRWEGPP